MICTNCGEPTAGPSPRTGELVCFNPDCFLAGQENEGWRKPLLALRYGLDMTPELRDEAVQQVTAHVGDLTYRYERVVAELRDIHWDRNGYCNECGGRFPCLTIQTITK